MKVVVREVTTLLLLNHHVSLSVVNVFSGLGTSGSSLVSLHRQTGIKHSVFLTSSNIPKNNEYSHVVDTKLRLVVCPVVLPLQINVQLGRILLA